MVDDRFEPNKIVQELTNAGLAVSQLSKKANHKLPHLYDRRFRDAQLQGEFVEPAPPPRLPCTEQALTNVLFLPLSQFSRRNRRKRLRSVIAALEVDVKQQAVHNVKQGIRSKPEKKSAKTDVHLEEVV